MSIARFFSRVTNLAGTAADIIGGLQGNSLFGGGGAPTSYPAPGGGFSTGGTLRSLPALPAPAATMQGHVCPSGYHLAKDGSGRMVRNRRMNPTNPRALKRSIRRIKAFRKIAHSIERQLPTRTVRSRR